MGMKSYAQNFEDVYLERAFKKVQVGYYIDLGAYHPITDSVTKHFYDRGWSGINVEPGPMFHALVKARPRDTNLRVAITNRSGAAKFYYHRGRPGTSTMLPELTPALADIVGERDISITNTMTLNELIAEYAAGRKIHFLKIDIEGNEEDVILSTDWTAFKVEILVIESTLPMSNTRRDDRWNNFLAMSGYDLAFFDGINSYYVHKDAEHLKEAFYAPVNALDYAEKQDTRPEDFDDESLTAAGRAGIPTPSDGDDALNLALPAAAPEAPAPVQGLPGNLLAYLAMSRDERDRMIEAVRDAARTETDALRGDVARLLGERNERDALRERISELEAAAKADETRKIELHNAIEERNAFIAARQIDLAAARQQIDDLAATGAERDAALAAIEAFKSEIDALNRRIAELVEAEAAARLETETVREQSARVTAEWAEQFRQTCLLRDETTALGEKLAAREAEAAGIHDAREAALAAAAAAELDRVAALREVEIVRRESAIFLDTMLHTERANVRVLEAAIDQLKGELSSARDEAARREEALKIDVAHLQSQLEAQGATHEQTVAALEASIASLELRASTLQRDLADSVEDAERTRRESAFLMEAVLETPRREIETLGLALSQAKDRSDRLIPGLERDLSTANATIDRLADERADLIYDLRFPNGPRALKLVLPLARAIRGLTRLGRKAPARPSK